MALFVKNPNQSTLILLVSEPEPIVSDEDRKLVESVLNVAIFAFGSLGVVTNAINIRVFVHQGLMSDSNTIGLCALAVADLLGCFFLIPPTMCQVLKYINTASPAMVISCISLNAFAFQLPHLSMSRITCWITVYIAIERCLCVLIPFKVKLLLSPKVALVAMSLIYVVLFAVYMPLYSNYGLTFAYNPVFNSSIIIFTETAMAGEISNYLGLIYNTVLTTVAVIVVAIATGLMLYKLNQYKKWRQNSASTGNKRSAKGDNSDSQNKPDSAPAKRDVEILKTVVTVTGLFLVCLSMSHFPGFASALLPGFSITGLNKNLFYLLYLYKFVFDLINSSLNFFFYIKISSRYKTAYDGVFKRQNK